MFQSTLSRSPPGNLSKLIRTALIIGFIAQPSSATLPVHKKPSVIVLSGSCGGKLDGSAWTSAAIAGRVFAVYYIDPDAANLNEPLFSALKAQNFPADKVRSVAVINMRATWLPAGILSMGLKSKQEKYPGTLYVKDNCKKLAAAWNLRDHSSDVLIFSAYGEVLFSIDGKLTDAQIREAVAIIWKELGGKGTDAHR